MMRLISLVLAGTISAVAAQAQPQETTTSMANPAATFCVENGGDYQIRDDAEGNKTGVCVFPDGFEADAWELLRTHFEQE